MEMDEENKLPLKRVEFSLTKFNEVAIPHHLDLLRQHKANIIKYEEQGEYSRARAEQTHARRVAAQLRALLLELEALRRQVRASDRPRFDALTQRSRDTTLRAIVDYLGTSPLAIKRQSSDVAPAAASAVSTESVGVVAHVHADGDEDTRSPPPELAMQIQLHVDDTVRSTDTLSSGGAQSLALQERAALLRGWSELQAELRALHGVWQHAQAAALAQRAPVAAAAAGVELASDHVATARGHLAAAERHGAAAWGAWGAWGAGGAALGLLAGGPVGLAVGAKAGALAAAAGSLLGLLGARALAARRALPAPDACDVRDVRDKDKAA